MTRHLLIVNPRSGGGRVLERIPALLDKLSQPGAEFETVITERSGHATDIAKDAASQYDILIAVGGDGTVSEVVTGCLASGVADIGLAILPMGTGNDIAHNLDIVDWETAVSALRDPEWRSLDACEVHYTPFNNEGKIPLAARYSLLGVGIGFPAKVVGVANQRVKRYLGHWAYLYATLACSLTYRCPSMRIVADGQVHEGKIVLSFILNMEWTSGHSMRIAPGANCDDGWLNVMLMRESCRLRSLHRLSYVLKGKHAEVPEIEYFPAREICVESDPPVEVSLDGDLVGTTPVWLKVLPGMVRVKVPKSS